MATEAQRTMKPFCDNVQKVSETILETDPLGKGTNRLARRLREALDRRNAGFHPGRPEVFLLIGNADSRLDEKIDAVGQSLIAKTIIGGLSPVTRISCAEFFQHPQAPQNPLILAPLIGPPDATGGFLPVLANAMHTAPDVRNRIGARLVPLRKIEAKILESLNDKTLVPNKWRELVVLVKKINEDIAKIYEDNRPYRSVIAFTGLETSLGVASLFRVIREVCQDGATMVTDGKNYESALFSDSIILLTLTWRYEDDPGSARDSRSERGSFNPLPNETSAERFVRLLGFFKNVHPNAQVLIEDILSDDRVIIVDPPTRASITVRFALAFKRMATQLSDHFGVEMTHSNAFEEWLLDHSNNPDAPDHYSHFTEAWRRYVVWTLADAIVEQRLPRSSRLTFDVNAVEKNTQLNIDAGDPNAAPITPQEIANIFSEEPIQEPPETEEAKAYRLKLEALLGPAATQETSMGLYL